jgi:hypothetical protein
MLRVEEWVEQLESWSMRPLTLEDARDIRRLYGKKQDSNFKRTVFFYGNPITSSQVHRWGEIRHVDTQPWPKTLDIEEPPHYIEYKDESVKGSDAPASVFDSGLGGIFRDPQLIQKLAANAKTAPLLTDSAFMGRLQAVAKDPNLVGQEMSDPRFVQVMGVLMGIDMDMPSEEASLVGMDSEETSTGPEMIEDSPKDIIHYTISRDFTGTNDEVASKILAPLRERSERTIFPQAPAPKPAAGTVHHTVSRDMTGSNQEVSSNLLAAFGERNSRKADLSILGARSDNTGFHLRR